MSCILHIDSSYNTDRSASRVLSREFIEVWKTFHPEDTVIYRDLGHSPVPYINELHIAAAFSPPETHTPEMKEVLKVSDTLVEEFLTAERYVFGVPMYGFNVPATFKAYVEHLVRPGVTYRVDERGLTGLVNGKKALFITSRGGDYRSGAPLAACDIQEPYLRIIFGSFGITELQFINANNLVLGDPVQSLAEAQAAIREMATCW